MKKIWNAIARPIKNSNYQKKALKQFEKIASDKVRVRAPLHDGDKERYEEAQKNEEVRKDLETKHEGLISNMNKFSVRSTEPVERWSSDKELPTRESEWLHRNDPVWEYGFYEPPEEKIPKGKLMFREALEIMRARLELTNSEEFKREQQSEAQIILQEHPAVKRVDKERLDRMWQYFRPFERRDTQKVVRVSDVIALQEALHGYSDESSAFESVRETFSRMLKHDPSAKDAFEKLDHEQQKEFFDAVIEMREEQRKRLEARLLEVGTTEDKKGEEKKGSSEDKKKDGKKNSDEDKKREESSS